MDTTEQRSGANVFCVPSQMVGTHVFHEWSCFKLYCWSLLLLSYSKAPWRLTVDFVLTFDIQCWALLAVEVMNLPLILQTIIIKNSQETPRYEILCVLSPEDTIRSIIPRFELRPDVDMTKWMVVYRYKCLRTFTELDSIVTHTNITLNRHAPSCDPTVIFRSRMNCTLETVCRNVTERTLSAWRVTSLIRSCQLSWVLRLSLTLMNISTLLKY